MSNFTSIENALLLGVSGGGVEGSGEVTTAAGSAKGAVKVTQDPVKQYGDNNNLLACKQQASDNFGAWYQSGARLDQQLADCNKQFGKP
jgi:hypothetical protein